MSTLEINGTSLEYAEQGEGEPLVFVHGSASDYRTWHNQQEEFARTYRVITYSRRYHWPNEQIPEDADYSMLEHVEDLRALIQELGAVPAHLVGHSYGAFLCLLLAIKEPHLVNTLVLAEPPIITLFVSDPPKPPEILKLLVSRPRTAISIINLGVRGLSPAAAAAKRGDREEAMQLFGTAVLGEEHFRQLSEDRLNQVRDNLIKAEILKSGFLPVEAQQVHNLDIPTLLLNGEQSPSVFHRLTDRLQELLPNSERVEIDGASHMMHEDNVSAYNAAVLSFLERQQHTA
jgi:pimeloyl-ACP methyl ester carboxylesterase